MRQAERAGDLSDPTGGMVHVRRSAKPTAAAASGRRGTMVVAVSSADKPSRAPMTVAARTLSQRGLTSGPRTSRSLHSALIQTSSAARPVKSSSVKPAVSGGSPAGPRLPAGGGDKRVARLAGAGEPGDVGVECR